MTDNENYDVLIIGSGAAGLSLALQLPSSYRCGVLSKAHMAAGSTFWAQGGMAAVLHDRDSFDAHEADTVDAGAGLCHEPIILCKVTERLFIAAVLCMHTLDCSMPLFLIEQVE